MGKSYTFTARVEEGRLKFSLQALQHLRRAVTDWQRCPVTVTIEKEYATRGLTANALYWAGYVKPLAEYTGRPPRVVHALLKKLFLPKERIEIVDKRTGVVVDEVDLEALTTTTLNELEFSQYLKEIEEWVMDTFHGDVHVGSNREHAV